MPFGWPWPITGGPEKLLKGDWTAQKYQVETSMDLSAFAMIMERTNSDIPKPQIHGRI